MLHQKNGHLLYEKRCRECHGSHYFLNSTPPWPKRKLSLWVRTTFLWEIKCNHSKWQKSKYCTLWAYTRIPNSYVSMVFCFLFLNQCGICNGLFLKMFWIHWYLPPIRNRLNLEESPNTKFNPPNESQWVSFLLTIFFLTWWKMLRPVFFYFFEPMIERGSRPAAVAVLGSTCPPKRRTQQVMLYLLKHKYSN